MATLNKSQAEIKLVHDQVRQYRKVYPRYEKLGQVLNEVLKQIARKYAPLAIVQTRPKNIASFAEKIRRLDKISRG